jgi:hypothetical protein
LPEWVEFECLPVCVGWTVWTASFVGVEPPNDPLTVVITGSCDMSALEEAVIDSHPSASAEVVLPALRISVWVVDGAGKENGRGNVVSTGECSAGTIDEEVEFRYFRTGPARPYCAQIAAITRCRSDGILM